MKKKDVQRLEEAALTVDQLQLWAEGWMLLDWVVRADIHANHRDEYGTEIPGWPHTDPLVALATVAQMLADWEVVEPVTSAEHARQLLFDGNQGESDES